jgi:ABC-type proline/glycine betaine transport system permease subunit
VSNQRVKFVACAIGACIGLAGSIGANAVRNAVGNESEAADVVSGVAPLVLIAVSVAVGLWYYRHATKKDRAEVNE